MDEQHMRMIHDIETGTTRQQRAEQQRAATAKAEAALAPLEAKILELREEQDAKQRAEVYREVAERLAADADQGEKEGWTRIYRRAAAAKVREWADEARQPAPAATEATEPAESPLRDQIATVIRDFPFDNYGMDDVSYALEDDPNAQEWVPALADKVRASILPGARITATLARMADADVQRVIALYEQWVTAGPPPLGVSLARWWDARLAELHNAILPPTDQPKEQ